MVLTKPLGLFFLPVLFPLNCEGLDSIVQTKIQMYILSVHTEFMYQYMKSSSNTRTKTSIDTKVRVIDRERERL